MQIKFNKLDPKAKIPQYAHPGDAGMDIFSIEGYTLQPGERHVFKTGIASELPEGYFVRCAPKSGLAVNDGIDLLAGVVDNGYRGEWLVTLINHSDKPKEFRIGDKLAQGILLKLEIPEMIEVTELSETERGAGRFGSTGR